MSGIFVIYLKSQHLQNLISQYKNIFYGIIQH